MDAAPEADTGMLSTIFRPVVAQAGSAGIDVSRRYVPYPATFGGWTGTSDTRSYADSVSEGVDRLREEIAQHARQCPDSIFALAGYSQGAHAVSVIAREIGNGSGPVDPDRVGGVALFGSPTRSAGSGPFPGTSAVTPSAAPGTSGTAVGSLDRLELPDTADGGGIGPVADIAREYGDLTGRVADICISGDLACDAPSGAPIVRVVANVAGRSEMRGDPIESLSTVATALAETALKTGVDVINEDIQIGPSQAIDTLSIQPQKTISERLAEASDPRTPPPSGDEIVSALMKTATIGFGLVTQVAETVLTPTNIATLATVGLANPAAGLATLGGMVVGALADVIPPTTASRLTRETFDLVGQEIETNSELLDLATATQYFDTVRRHGSYGSHSSTATGASPTTWTADWFTALAQDAAASTTNSSTE